MQSGGFLVSRSANRSNPETAYKTLFFRLSKSERHQMKIEQQFETEVFINASGSITIKQDQWPEETQIITIQLCNVDLVISELKTLKKELKEQKKQEVKNGEG